MHHGSPTPAEVRDPVAERRAARIGLVLFAIYLAAYAAFVLINAFRPALMDEVVYDGLNLAVVFGMGLIGGALMLALLYAVLCRRPAGGRA